MKQTDEKRIPNGNQPKRPAQSDIKEKKLRQEQISRVKGTKSKILAAKSESDILESDSNTGTVASEVFEDCVVHYMDDDYRPPPQNTKSSEMADKEKQNETPKDLGMEPLDRRVEDSDSETVNDSVSSNGDSQIGEDEKGDRVSGFSQRLEKKDSSGSSSRARRIKSENGGRRTPTKPSVNTQMRTSKSSRGPSNATAKNVMKVHPKPSSESSGGADEQPLDDAKEMDILDETLPGAQSVGSDNAKEIVNAEEHVDHEDKEVVDLKIGEMEKRIAMLEEELREVAALEISLYFVVPEHGSSAHKVHTPARRLSRLYVHACKHWSQDNRATVARNTVSGLVLITKSCGNDVSRLTFWWSNTIVLREIIAQAFGSSVNSSSFTMVIESNGVGKKKEGISPSLKANGGRNPNKLGFMEVMDDWQETRTFTSALEKVESWIFSRIIESIWWQTLTPNMQSVSADTSNTKTIGKLLGPALGDQRQVNFSINLWKIAFFDAFKRLCPVRAAGHECGCLPILARMVMEQCIARLDVAMFNAILRESAHEIPTDPVSDPIVDSKVLPIPAGDLSFGSGAQLKNSVGYWSRWLTDLFGMDADDSVTEEHEMNGGDPEFKCFHLLNALSDLLMLPKDMILDRSIREEVCPSISLPLLKRILCNFTPDEFCPDHVPGAVLEALNAECIIERRLSGDTSSSFPYIASPVKYKLPSSADVSVKVSEAGAKSSQLSRNVSTIQRKGYTSDEELDELCAPLTFIIDKLPPSSLTDTTNEEQIGRDDFNGPNARYDLLREVWSS